MSCGAPGGVEPMTAIRCSGFSVTGVPAGRPVVGSITDTSTTPVSSVKRDVTPPGVPGVTSATTTVPRTAVIAFGVLISITSPRFMRSLLTDSAS